MDLHDATVDELFALARSAETEPAYWEAVSELHGRADDRTFSLGAQIDSDTPELRDALAARLSDDHGDTRSEAIRGLARRGDMRALEPALAADRSAEIDEALAQLAAVSDDPRLTERVDP